MGKGGGGGGGSSKTTSTAEPWKDAQPYLKGALAQAQQEYERNGGLSGNWVDKNLPDLTPEMKQSVQMLANNGMLNKVMDNLDKMGSGAQGNQDAAQAFFQSQLAGKEGITADQVNQMSEALYDNDLVDSQKSMLAQDLQKQYETNVSNLNVNAAGSGNMGNSRAGVAQGVMAGEEQTALAKGTADIVNNARQAAMGQATAILQNNQASKASGAQNLGNLSNAQMNYQNQAYGLSQQKIQNMLNAGQITQQQANALAENQWFNQEGARQAGWENYNQYLGAISSLGGMGGSGTSVAKGAQTGGQSKTGAALGGALAGAGTGAMIGSVVPGVGTAIGAVAGGIIGGASGLFSDPALKTKVRKTGKTSDGDTTYDYQWNDSKAAKKAGLKGKASGVLATEVAKRDPSAVTKAPSGSLGVDYSKVKIKPKNTKKAK